jgi:hypothetical protein
MKSLHHNLGAQACYFGGPQHKRFNEICVDVLDNMLKDMNMDSSRLLTHNKQFQALCACLRLSSLLHYRNNPSILQLLWRLIILSGTLSNDKTLKTWNLFDF